VTGRPRPRHHRTALILQRRIGLARLRPNLTKGSGSVRIPSGARSKHRGGAYLIVKDDRLITDAGGVILLRYDS
jgi:hypothetical protein